MVNPLPISRLCYHLGVDLCGLFKTTDRGHKSVMIAIDRFSTYTLLVPLTDKHAGHQRKIAFTPR